MIETPKHAKLKTEGHIKPLGCWQKRIQAMDPTGLILHRFAVQTDVSNSFKPLKMDAVSAVKMLIIYFWVILKFGESYKVVALIVWPSYQKECWKVA